MRKSEKAKKVSVDMSEESTKPKRPEKAAAARPSRLAPDIDENLKRVYAAALQEEVPDRFRLLLAQLREKEQKEKEPKT